MSDVEWGSVCDWTADHVMGWGLRHEIDAVGNDAYEYYDADGRFVMAADDWEPHESWHECGMVVEAMKSAGWLATIRIYDEGALCRYHHGIDRNCKMIDMHEALCGTEKQAVVLAAAYATGYKDGNDE